MRSKSAVAFARLGRAIVVAAGIGATCVPSGASADGLEWVPGYYRTSWLPDERTPVDIQALAQTRDGYLWLGGRTGLYRFDGARIERFEPPLDPALPAHAVTALASDEGGGLWIAMSGGHTLRLKDHRLEHEAILPVASGPVLRFVASDSAHPLALTTSGLFLLDAATWRPLRIDGLAQDVRYYDAWLDARGGLWVATTAGIRVRDAGRREFRIVTDQTTGSGRFSSSRNGDLWFCGELGGLFKLSPELLGPEPGGGTCYQFFIDSENGAWIMSSLGEGRRTLAALEHDAAAAFEGLIVDAMGQDAIGRAFLEDQEGNVWVGTAHGLVQFRRNRLQEPPSPGGTGGLAPADDGVWVISHSRGLMRVGPATTTYPDAGKRFTYITRGPHGVIWAGGQRRGELIRIEGEDLTSVPFPPGAEDVYVNAIGAGREGSLWVSTQPSPKGMVYRRNGSDWIPRGGVPGLPEMAASAISVDADERAWIGYADNQLFVVDGTQTIRFDQDDGLDVGVVRHVLHRGGATYVGGDNGVFVRTQGGFRPVRLRKPHRALGVVDMLFTRKGDLWVNQAGSVLRLPAAELAHILEDAAYEAGAESFDSRDGRKGSPPAMAPHPTLAETDDGMLWIAGANLTAVASTDIPRNSHVPGVELVFIDVNGVRTRPGKAAIEIAPGGNDVTIGYTALSLTMPERVRFRYRLEGYDARWREGGVERSAAYANLPPGNYRFKVIASNNDGVWNEVGAGVALRVRPAYHQTLWFKLGATLTVLLALAWAMRARMRFIAARIKDRMRERSRERERIARELHDTLLQGIQGLILHFQSIADDIPAQDPNRQQMEKALDRADQMMGEARESVSDLRLQQEGASLGASLQRHFGELRPKDNLVARVRETGIPHDLVPVVRTEVLRIAHEAIANALQHSRLRRLHIVVRYDPRALSLRVRDDGCGLAGATAQSARPGHWGLRGMQERATGIAAQLRVAAAKGRGTVVDLRVPASIAYADHHNPIRLRLAERFRRLRLRGAR
jgi:signal transduction histidine kinase/ligand-binding sensor domain-containing protein